MGNIFNMILFYLLQFSNTGNIGNHSKFNY